MGIVLVDYGKKANVEKPKAGRISFYFQVRRLATTELVGLFFLFQLLGLQILQIFHTAIWLQSIGFLFFLIGVSISFSGRIALGANWTHAIEYQIKKRHTLTTTGIYKYIRHPIYAGLILAATGAQLVVHSYLFIVFFIVLFFCLL